ncbi:Stp1/IreP family PP2C-type Ser/Thr phosphatase [Ferviditalea candida]|uniref:Stp1/IreP family PP2C-type Ser/Thr phosphatase n=1 Tax=Ferviditalea candida TaxID=3108399 RepID=A0ABU5ZHT8_9BACL|nr:Stp1/IreP family PP2C-type Ser/Thr phosphatase [Paenibacillaceae bacterium T2]
MKTALKSDVGLIRTVNEDRAVVQNRLNGFTLAIVADGMGGHQAGDIASQIAIDTVKRELQNIEPGMSPEECGQRIADAVRKANREVFEIASSQEQYQGMGTTIVVALVSDELIIIAHIGDSRAYKLDDEFMIQLTEDHSLVNELVKSGQISPEEANSHPRRNVLTRALGTDEQVEVDLCIDAWKQEDVLLLCSDGLSSLLDDGQITAILRSGEELQSKANLLVQSALQAGGDDNITVVLLANVQADDEEKG